MHPEKSLKAKKNRVERELARLLSVDNSRLFQAMRYSVLGGGKRYRPLLLISSGACFGVPGRILLPFACGLELIHSYSLIHDDLPAMDDDDMRRGKPSCHRAFGDDVALLAGDGLLTLAFETLAGAAVPAGMLPLKQSAIRLIGSRAGAGGMIGGQFLDITLEPERLSEAQMEELVLKKTGSLITAAVEAGAILGRARPAERRAINNYGRNIGLAFQVRDDILDSEHREQNGSPRRPDYVSLLGRRRAEKRLAELVFAAVASLNMYAQRAEELRFLARSLLDLKTEAPHA